MGKSQPFFLGKSVKKSVRERLRYIVRNFGFFQVFFASSLLQSGSPSVLRSCFVRASSSLRWDYYIGGNGRFCKVFGCERFCRYSLPPFRSMLPRSPKNARGAALYFRRGVGAIFAINATRKEYGANSGIVAAHAPLKRKIPRFRGINRKCGR